MRMEAVGWLAVVIVFSLFLPHRHWRKMNAMVRKMDT
jgi:hypothetical protein